VLEIEKIYKLDADKKTFYFIFFSSGIVMSFFLLYTIIVHLNNDKIVSVVCSALILFMFKNFANCLPCNSVILYKNNVIELNTYFKEIILTNHLQKISFINKNKKNGQIDDDTYINIKLNILFSVPLCKDDFENNEFSDFAVRIKNFAEINNLKYRIRGKWEILNDEL